MPRKKSTRSTTLDLLPTLHKLGFESFRPGQEETIRALLNGQDVLSVLPTGGGKSLIYQFAAQEMTEGVTLVVSPLIALMKDQVESVAERGIEAEVIDSTRSEAQAEEALERVAAREARLLYVTPERFDDEEFMAELLAMKVALFVVDEAHCVSEWGHSFRPSYLALAGVAERLDRPPKLALTATATPWLRQEIIDRLAMRQPRVVVRGTDRPNLFYEVRRVETDEEDRRLLERLLLAEEDDYSPELNTQLTAAMQGSGIIYTLTTRAAEETAAWLTEWGIAADYYHGQRNKADRERVQDAFMAGELRVIAATTAFGMGVDKPDVQFVIHRDIPASVEAYYQEAGRAGRDGAFARCLLIYRPADLGRAAALSGGGRLTLEDVQRGRAGLLAHPTAPLKDLEAVTGLTQGDLARLITLLERDSIVAEEAGQVRLLVPDFDPEQVSLAGEEHRRAYERSRLEMMRGYAEDDECRRRYILNYFGEEYAPGRCDHCDNDVPRAGVARFMVEEAAPVDSPFALGDAVTHTTWGAGTVQRVTGDTLTVLFETAGYKTLATSLVQERGLLRPA